MCTPENRVRCCEDEGGLPKNGLKNSHVHSREQDELLAMTEEARKDMARSA